MMSVPQFTQLKGELQYDHVLASYTSWRVGGKADIFFKPTSADDLANFLQQLPLDIPVTWLGLGSNLLVRDGGVRGAVILLHGVETRLELDATNNQVIAGAGVPCAKLAKFAAKNSLSGATFFAGIPGTLGGALAMNAGAFGGETWEVVTSVSTVDRSGVFHNRQKMEYTIAYRSVKGPSECFLNATIQLEAGSADSEKEAIKTMLAKRAESQPTGVASCGSVFRNPTGDYAARLIDSLGLKGHRIGGAQISEKHANFIINTGSASAHDLEELVAFAQTKVEEKYDIQLIPEVRTIGEAL